MQSTASRKRSPPHVALHVVVLALLSGLFAAVVAAAVTRAIERLGGTTGGILSTIPTTIVPASIGLAAAADGDHDALIHGLFAVPAGIILDVAFLYLWRVLPSRIERLWPATVEAPRKLLWAMIASTLTIWLIAALLLTLVLGSISEDNTTGIKVIGSLALIAVFLFGIFAAVLRPAPSPAGTQHVSWAMLCARGSAAGVAIFFAVLISDASETAGGIVSVFPAIFVTSMVGIWIQQGRSVSQGAVGPMCLNIVGVGLYAVVFPAAFQSTGYWAVPLSWFTGVSYSCVVYVLLHRYYNKLIADGRLQAPDADADIPMAAGGPGKLVVDASDDIHLDLPPADGDTTLPADEFVAIPITPLARRTSEPDAAETPPRV